MYIPYKNCSSLAGLSKPAATKKGAAKRPPFVTSLYNEADYAPDEEELDDEEEEPEELEELDPFTSSPPGQNS